MMSDKISCALDLSGPFASFSVKNEISTLLTGQMILKNRNNLNFFSFFTDNLKEVGLTVSDIGEWIVGTGPGSFTGLRIVSSFVLGITYKKKHLTIKGLASGFPMALAVDSHNESSIGVIFPASLGMIFLFYIYRDKEGKFLKKESKILKEDTISELNNFGKIVFLKDEKLEELIFANGIEKRNTTILENFPVKNMFYDFGENYTNIQDLEYMRPASINMPNSRKG